MAQLSAEGPRPWDGVLRWSPVSLGGLTTCVLSWVKQAKQLDYDASHPLQLQSTVGYLVPEALVGTR